VVWSHDRPSQVFGVRHPDGSRGDASHKLDFGFRRSAAGAKRWVYGNVDIRPDDVLFVDGDQQPSYMPPPITDVPDLEAELARDPAFLAAIKDDRFARAVYTVFRNRAFRKGTGEQSWECGDREAARLVAALRNLGESYQDYFPYGDIKGVWPDDRAAREAQLRNWAETWSQPHDPSFDIKVPSSVVIGGVVRRVESAEEAETARRDMLVEFEKHKEKMAQQRRDALERLREAAAEIQENPNGDVFGALHAHLTRLDWRTENEVDRQRARARLLQRGVQVLQVIKGMETRADGRLEEWTEAIRKRRQLPSGEVRFHGKDALNRLTPDEREVTTGVARRRLDQLALTGRVTKEEYDSLSLKLEGR
jgi:hypothetical protein